MNCRLEFKIVGFKSQTTVLKIYSIVLSPEFNNEDINLLIEKLLFNGVLYILHAEYKETPYLGLVCWSIAIKLQESFGIHPKKELDISPSLKLLLKQKTELKTQQQVKGLICQKRKHWIHHAFIITRRIIIKYDAHPNVFLLRSYYDYLLKNWYFRLNTLTSQRALTNVMVIIKMFEEVILKTKMLLENAFEVIQSVLFDLSRILSRHKHPIQEPD